MDIQPPAEPGKGLGERKTFHAETKTNEMQFRGGKKKKLFFFFGLT